jgi:hypothetical protein
VNDTDRREFIAASKDYVEVTQAIIERLVEDRDSTTDQKSQSMHDQLMGRRGKRKPKPRVVPNNLGASPSQVAAAHEIGKAGLHVVVSKPKAAPVEETSRKSVEQIIAERLAPLGLDAKAAREARIIEAVQAEVMAESRPLGYSYATWRADQRAAMEQQSIRRR